MTIKALREKKNSLIEALEELNRKCEERAEKGEDAALTEEEAAEYDKRAKELDNVCELLKRKEAVRERALESSGNEGEDDEEEKKKDGEGEDGEASEEDDETEEEARAEFMDFIRGVYEEKRADATNLTMGDNGAIVPKSIAKKVISKVEDICDVYQRATKFHFKGEVAFPVIDDSTDDVVVAYADEFAGLTSHVNKFTSITLKGYLYASLCLLSKSLINNSDINVFNIITTRMALALSKFLEKECLMGTTGKMEGILSTGNVYQTDSSTAITADDLISLQDMIPDVYQKDCVFYMHRETRTMLKKLKNSDGDYLLTCDLTTGFKNMLLGKPVIVSDQMPKVAAGNTAIFYGDPSGLYINIRENMNVQVLREKYAEFHAIGLNLWAESDSKIVEKQKLSTLKLKAASGV